MAAAVIVQVAKFLANLDGTINADSLQAFVAAAGQYVGVSARSRAPCPVADRCRNCAAALSGKLSLGDVARLPQLQA